MRAWLRRLLREKSRFEDGYLLPEPAFQSVLERERMRADRTGGEFSVVLWGFGSAAPPEEQVRHFSRLLQERLRATDVAGRSAQGRIGVLLPETPEAGAFKVIEDVRASWRLAVPLSAEVYVYPSERRNGSSPRRSYEAETPWEQPAAVVRSQAALFARPIPLWKRSLDVCGATVGLVFAAPVMLLAALAIWVTSGRPIFFRQLRAGFAGRPFWIYKFRTMCPDAERQQAHLRAFSEQDGPAFKLRDDPRLTPIGRLLRRTSIDELPQLWNVLRGEMSLVGPRPLPCHESDACDGWQRRRLDVTPGLTCLWQITGRSRVTFDEWMRMDVRYIRTRSLYTDLSLVLRTIPAVLLQRGAQ